MGWLTLCVLADVGGWFTQKAKKNLEAYAKGKTQLFGFFIGQVMKNSGGRVNPELANAVMQELLNEYASN